MFINNKKAFTITELVVALGIVGVVATLTIPHIAKDINRKTLTSQIKNTVASLQQVVADEIADKRTSNLKDTDFDHPEKLLSEEHFEVLRVCTNSDNCWGKYRYINPSKNTNTTNNTINSNSIRTIKLRNGVVMGYSNETPGKANTIGRFYIDVNGGEEPNIVGRDFFALYLTNTGKLVGNNEVLKDGSKTKCYTITNFNSGAFICMQALMDNNWRMPDNDAEY